MIRGGSISAEPIMNNGNVESITVIVSSSLGSSFLDKKKKLSILNNETVADLKQQILLKFPGSPPIQLQKLYYGSTLLNDSVLVTNLTTLSPIPLLLDMITGTSAYNRTMSVSQAIEAYVSSLVHQSFVSEKIRVFSTPNLGEESTNSTRRSPDSQFYRSLFNSINNSIYEKYKDDILEALERERNPETRSLDTEAWRNPSRRVSNPLAVALAKEFDMNGRTVRSFIYTSIVLGVFGYFGASTESTRNLMLMLIPTIWITKFRQLRILSKISLYFALPFIAKTDFLLPLLPAPLRTIAIESNKWISLSSQDDSTKEKSSLFGLGNGTNVKKTSEKRYGAADNSVKDMGDEEQIVEDDSKEDLFDDEDEEVNDDDDEEDIDEE
eukprot:gene9423-12696_t